MAFTQDFFTSRRNYEDGSTRIGQKDRLWYESVSNTIRISDGVTPGGIIVSGGSIDAILYLDGGGAYSEYTGTTAIDGGGI